MCTVNERIKVIKMLSEGVGFHVENWRNFHTTGVKKLFISQKVPPKEGIVVTGMRNQKRRVTGRGCF